MQGQNNDQSCSITVFSFENFKADKSCEMRQISLHSLAIRNDVDQLTRVLDLRKSQGVEIDINEIKNDKTVLHTASECNVGSSHYKMAEILLSYGADPNAKDGYCGKTPLYNLLLNPCNLEILNLFSKYKADFTFKDSLGVSLLALAVCDNFNLDVVKFLVEDIGLDVNQRDLDEWTPLHHAAYHNQIDSHYEVLKYLLEMGADVNARNNNGFTPIWELVRAGNSKVVDLFLSRNADFNVVSDFGRSVLFAFSDKNSDVQVLDKFINYYGLDVNYTDFYLQTPLLHIISCNSFNKPININVIKCLLKNGAYFKTDNQDGLTALVRTVRSIREEDDEWFLKNMDFLNFLIEQTDFSVVYNYDKHIFYYDYSNEDYEYDDDDDYDDYDRSLLKYLWKLILEHLAKLKFLSILINPLILEYIEDHTDYKDYFQKCAEELELMSNTKPENSWINLFNLLVDRRRKLKNYAGNPDLIRVFENSDCLKMFPIYGAKLKKSVEKGIIRRELFDESSILLSDCLPILNPNHLIIKDILDCILRIKDLSKFCK